METTKSIESRLRWQLSRCGYKLQKPRGRGTYGYQIADSDGGVIAGDGYSFSLENASDWTADEFEAQLSARAEALGMDLRQDGDGFYWLDLDISSIGPLDGLDAVAAMLDEAEAGAMLDDDDGEPPWD